MAVPLRGGGGGKDPPLKKKKIFWEFFFSFFFFFFKKKGGGGGGGSKPPAPPSRDGNVQKRKFKIAKTSGLYLLFKLMLKLNIIRYRENVKNIISSYAPIRFCLLGNK